MAEFKESEHPRDKDGKFTDKGKRVAKALRFRKAKERYGYTKNQYNNFGWARGNEILSAGQNKDFTSKFAQATKGLADFPKTPNGDYMIAVGEIYGETEGVNDIIVYAKGTISNPVITRVVKIDLDNETTLTVARGELRYFEHELQNDRTRILEAVGELFTFYNSDDYKV